MLIALLTIAIAMSLASIAMQVRSQRRWHASIEATRAHQLLFETTLPRLHDVEQSAHRVVLAHRRVAKQVHKLDLRVPKRALRPPPEARPFDLRMPARSWADDDYETRRMDGGETFLPVDFRHDLW
jgi:hypothetical protein